MLDRASGNLRVTNRASACLHTFDISDLALRGEEIEPIDEPRSREVDSAPSAGSTSAVDDPFILLFDVVDPIRSAARIKLQTYDVKLGVTLSMKLNYACMTGIF